MMKNFLIFNLCSQLALLIPALLAANPCTNYKNISVENSIRSSDCNLLNTDIDLPLCDIVLQEDTWYRFYDGSGSGTKLIEEPVAPWYCGTQAGIWMNGTHPTTVDEMVNVTVCAVYNTMQKLDNCGWNSTISIQLCNASGDDYFVYLLAVPSGCPLSYCLDAATRQPCESPLIWIVEECVCGENITRTTRSPTTTPMTPSPPPVDSSGYGPCGPWSNCSKSCDYGIQTCRKHCINLPCIGDGVSYQLCLEKECQELPEEKDDGILLVMKASVDQDTMFMLVQNQETINEIIRGNINDVCSRNVSICCGQNIMSNPPADTVYVAQSDIYTPQSYPRNEADGSVSSKVIAVLNKDTDNAICEDSSGKSKRQSGTTSNKYLSYDVMRIAVEGSIGEIYKETGLNVLSYPDPSVTAPQPVPTSSSSSSCPVKTCVIPIVVAIVVVIVAVVVIIGVYCHCTKKRGPPPSYDEALGHVRKPSASGINNKVRHSDDGGPETKHAND